jgi:LacI family gluconate utilization system Gnt-I transcriptional repressor
MASEPPIAAHRRERPSLRRSRLEDVAAAAGVSIATASRALRQPALVTAATRQRVDQAAQQLGYIRDAAAGNLASERTGQIAVVVPSFGTTAFMSTIGGISDHILPLGFQLVLADTNLSGDNEAKLIASLLGGRVDAIILTDVAQSAAAREMLAAARIPVVETWSLTTDPIDMNVGFDNHAAGFAATQHLVDRGRRNLGMICGPLQQNKRGRDRRQGFLEAARANGLDDAPVVELPYPFRWIHAEEALAELVSRRPELDGVFCSGDTFAAGALFGAQRRGWPVPGRIALIGLGDLEMNMQMVPSISTALVPGHRIGQIAAEMVVRRLRGESLAASQVDTGFMIVARESTAVA